MYALHYRVEDAASLQQAQRLLHEQGQVFGIGEAAVHIGNDLELSKLLAQILPQGLAGEIPYTVSAEDRGLLLPLICPAVLYRHRNRARPAAQPGALFSWRRVVSYCVVVQDRLPFAGPDIQPSVGATQTAERVAEPGGKKFRIIR